MGKSSNAKSKRRNDSAHLDTKALEILDAAIREATVSAETSTSVDEYGTVMQMSRRADAEFDAQNREAANLLMALSAGALMLQKRFLPKRTPQGAAELVRYFAIPYIGRATSLLSRTAVLVETDVRMDATNNKILGSTALGMRGLSFGMVDIEDGVPIISCTLLQLFGDSTLSRDSRTIRYRRTIEPADPSMLETIHSDRDKYGTFSMNVARIVTPGYVDLSPETRAHFETERELDYAEAELGLRIPSPLDIVDLSTEIRKAFHLD